MTSYKVLTNLISRTHRKLSFAKKICCTAVAVSVLSSLPMAAEAAQGAYVVGSDRGGYLHDRLRELTNLRKNGVNVQIRGNICYSTCTMYLGLPQTCVSPNTTFGFHGPSRSGQRLSQEQFDYFSTVMASYYPAPLRKWFMETGRNRINGVYKVKGQKLIQMGVRSC